MESGYEFDKYSKKKPQLRGLDGKFESKAIKSQQDFEIERYDSYGDMKGRGGRGSSFMDMGDKKSSYVFENQRARKTRGRTNAGG